MAKKIRFLFIFHKRPPVFAESQYYYFKIWFSISWLWCSTLLIHTHSDNGPEIVRR